MTTLSPNHLALPERTREKRPLLVWLIFLFFVLSGVFTLARLVEFYSGAVHMDAAQKAFFDRLDAFAWVSSLSLIAMNTTAAILLFCLWKSAVDVLVAATVLHAVIDVHSARMLGPTLGVQGWALILMVLLYAIELRQRGVLR